MFSSSTHPHNSPLQLSPLLMYQKKLFLLLLSLRFLTRSHALCNLSDQYSLLLLSSNIFPTLNWTSAMDCCSWEGISCDSNNRVTRLWLPSRGLRGSISPALVNLTALTELNLSHNFISNTLPDGFFLYLSLLRVVDLSYNYLSGKLPAGRLTSTIETLDLSSNHFNGTIPPSFFFQPSSRLVSFNISNNSYTGPLHSSICNSCPSLSVLDFSFNDFYGEIPQGFGACSNLKVLRAGFNNVSGQLSHDLFSCRTLHEISFPGNSLSGEIDGITNLTNLRILQLFGNGFTGQIPWDIGKLYNLEQLLLHINSLNGTLPPSLTNCKNLRILNLRVNYFSGNLSHINFSRFIHLTIVDLGNNNFSGVLPESLFSCKALTTVRLATNQLVGEISPKIVRLQSLSFLSLSNNRISNVTAGLQSLMSLKNLRILLLSKNFYNEALPDVDIVGFQSLQLLSLGGCEFSGQIPTWLGKLRNLKILSLSQNQISGAVPGWLGNLPNFFYLDLAENLLSGGIPIELTGLPCLRSQPGEVDRNMIYLELPVLVKPNNVSNLQYNQVAYFPPALNLAINNLSGNIPPEIGQLKLLHLLDLSENNFSGIIPGTLSDLTNLEYLDLSGNDLSGEIPASLQSLHFLSFFSVANNILEGPIPTGGQFYTFPNSSFGGNNALCGTILQRPCNHRSEESAPTNPSIPRKRTKDEYVLGVFIACGFGFGSTISVLALWIPISGRMLLNRIVTCCIFK